LYPRYVWDGREFDGGKEVGTKVTTFGVIPCKTGLLFAHEIVHQIVFRWLEEFFRMNFVECLVALFCITAGGLERRRIWIEGWHVCERVAGNVTNNAEPFRKFRKDRTNLLCDGFVFLLLCSEDAFIRLDVW